MLTQDSDFSILEISYNLPKLSPCATWGPHGVTFVNLNSSSSAKGIFVTLDNSVYAALQGVSELQMWPNASNASTKIFSTGSSSPLDAFVTINGDIYVDNGYGQNRVDSWRLNATNPTTVMYVPKGCFGLFVDIHDNLYCSHESPDQVVKRALSAPINSTSIVAGSGSDSLHGPRGIFVDIIFDCTSPIVATIEFNCSCKTRRTEQQWQEVEQQEPSH